MKKKDDEVSSLKEKFYNHVKENGNSINIANYVWEQCIKPQLAYSFSRNHVNPYSCEALQEMNLYHFNPTCYWNCAVLTVNAGLSNEENSKNTDYGKIAKAIYRSKSFNVDVLPPDINKADISFTPNEENNTILFGLGGISGINTEIAKQIIDNRPYTDFDDFYKKNKFDGSLVTKSKFVTLIKAGCFDETDDKITAMKWLSVYENPKKESLTTANIPNAVSMGMEFPNDLITAYNYKKYVLSKQFFYCNDPNAKSKKHYLVESEFALPYFEENCIDSLEEEKDYYYTNEGLVVIDKSLEKALKPKLELLKGYIGTQEFLDKYNTLMWQNAYLNLCGGSEDTNNWSFDAISFYPNGNHELANIDNEYYNVSEFSELSEEPMFIEKNYGKRSWKQYDICRICGTVLDKKDKDSYITILTPSNEVVNVKFNKGQYAYYKQVITDGDLKDESYFKRGTLLMISGYRKGEDTFVAKKYKNTPFQHTCIKVLKVNKDKSLELQLERLGSDNEL